jgi:hypothetical protein
MIITHVTGKPAVKSEQIFLIFLSIISVNRKKAPMSENMGAGIKMDDVASGMDIFAQIFFNFGNNFLCCFSAQDQFTIGQNQIIR